MVTSGQYVIFQLSDEYYGIRIDSVENIEKIVDITRVPGTPNYVKGVINMRGEIVPIIDLRLRLGLEEKEHDEETRIIINEIGEMMIGFIVDSTYEVIQIENSQIENKSNSEGKNTQSYADAIAKDKGRMIILLDMEKILTN